jgi:NAD(P)-dependent dehydrogenase (short-subunit alcohol dehydrogenase family)
MDALSRLRLAGRIALVTGASSGIGAAIAEGFAAAGATLVPGARRTERLTALAARIESAGGRALVAELDVDDAASIARAFAAAERAVGRNDVVVNSAGIGDSRAFVDTQGEDLARVMNTNFVGSWNVCQAAARRLIAAGAPGSIINIASILGLASAPRFAAHSASKGALIQLTRTLALEFAKHRIRVNAIAPGWFATEMTTAYFATDAGKAHAARLPIGRIGETQELVGPALLLASDAGSYISGVVLPVDAAHSVLLT